MPAPALRDPAQHPTPEERASSKHGKNYIPTLDGWRCLAILGVLEGHSQPWSFHGFSNQENLLGERGVALFFALSGFLICTRLLREEVSYGSISLKSFYTRRLFRIQPAALVYLSVVAMLTLTGAIPKFWRGTVGALLMVRNFWPGYYGTVYWYTGHFWSLSVEEHFYLLLPGFLVLVKRGRLATLACVVVLLELWRLLVLTTPALWKSWWILAMRTDLVIGGILLGSLSAVALTKPSVRASAQRWLHPWAVLLYAALVFAFLSVHNTRAEHALTITTFPLLIVATSLHPETLAGRLLEWAPLRFVGRISYSLYLWQEMFFRPYGRPNFIVAHAVIGLPCVFACALASYYLVETPMVRVGHRLAKRFDRPKLAA